MNINLKTMSPITILLIIILALLGTIGVIYALGTWQQGFTWTVPLEQTMDFTVYTDPAYTIEWTPGTPIDLGTKVIDDQIVKTFYVENTGTSQITVDVSDITSGATATWSPVTKSVSLSVGAITSFTLTLTVTGPGSCTVNIVIV